MVFEIFILDIKTKGSLYIIKSTKLNTLFMVHKKSHKTIIINNTICLYNRNPIYCLFFLSCFVTESEFQGFDERKRVKNKKVVGTEEGEAKEEDKEEEEKL